MIKYVKCNFNEFLIRRELEILQLVAFKLKKKLRRAIEVPDAY
jgi:hypothetical protein